MAKTNTEIIEAVKKEMSGSDRELLRDVHDGIQLLNVSNEHPHLPNAFISTLVNKVGKSLIFSKIYSNPLKELKKGKLEYGDSIEEQFVQMAMAKNFGENWDSGAATPEADLIRKLKPKVTAMYISVNFDKKYKTTVMDKQLRKAFTTEGGLSRLIMQIVSSITSQAEYTEFITTKKLINDLVAEAKCDKIDADHKVVTPTELPKGSVVKQSPYVRNTQSVADMVTKIRATVGDMKFPSTKYNLAKELNWCNPEDLVLITTPEIIAEMDTQVLASAFNVSKADLTTRTILVDEMPSGVFKKQGGNTLDGTPHAINSGDTYQKDVKDVYAILMDKDLLQIWDTYQGAGTFHNPEGEYTNHFANREGIFALCTFANMAVFVHQA